MELSIYNTASGQVEEFRALRPPFVGMYSCGLTVYYYTHIGNLRTYINTDVLRRTLENMGYEVKQVMNVTDVGHMTSDEDEGEDKLEVGARREGRTPWEIARFYEDYFFRSLDEYNVQKPTIICRATEHIEDMIALVRKLEERGYTYRTKIGVIFDTSRFPKYAEFAHLNLEQQYSGARVEVDPERKNAWDFALWVTNQPKHIMQWDSPWGRGFPGWHIECSAMSMKYLGEQLDIHSGGMDHIKVHHTNEIAQSEAATGKQFVRYWFHPIFLTVDGTKMSKSLGNLYTPDDVRNRGYSPIALRYLFLGSSYRKPINFTWEALTSAQTALARLWTKVAELPPPSGEPLRTEMQAFEEAIGSDLNTAKALAILFKVANSRKPAGEVATTVMAMDSILGLDLAHSAGRLEQLSVFAAASSNSAPSGDLETVRSLMEQRESLRQQRNFAEADALRDKIVALGYVIEDTPDGPHLKQKVG